MPRLEMRRFGWADTQQDSQNFSASHPLSQGWVEAGTTLLNKREVKSGSVGDGLDVVSRFKVTIGPGNCRMLAHIQARNRLRKRKSGVEIRVLGSTTIASPPTRVHG